MRHTMTVTGKGAFPIDMLRYDSCFPTSEDDSGKIIRSFLFPAETWEISVSKNAAGSQLSQVLAGNDVFMMPRWASFNVYRKF